MILYHGSTVAVQKPKILKTDRQLDFGKGFYLTSSYEQAKHWAELKSKRTLKPESIVSVFEVNDEELDKLKILRFDSPTSDWLKYVYSNRMIPYFDDDYDVVCGPVADDKTMPVIKMYFSGLYDEEETIKRLLPQKLTDQYDFKTEKAIKLLSFKEEIHV